MEFADEGLKRLQRDAEVTCFPQGWSRRLTITLQLFCELKLKWQRGHKHNALHATVKDIHHICNMLLTHWAFKKNLGTFQSVILVDPFWFWCKLIAMFCGASFAPFWPEILTIIQQNRKFLYNYKNLSVTRRSHRHMDKQINDTGTNVILLGKEFIN